MKKILIVVDMQKDFIDGALGTPEAAAIVPAVVRKIESYAAAGDIVVVTRDTHQGNYLDTQEGKFLPVPHCLENTEGWQFDARVTAALPNDAIYFNKPTFGSTALVDFVGTYVKEFGETKVQVELVGLCTDICVVSNALLLKAFYYEMPIFLDSACCAGVTHDRHKAALTTMRSCQIQVE